MTATPVWAGVVASDLDRSWRWYADTFGLALADRGARWTAGRFADGSVVELVHGDPARPGSAFPSYHDDPGPSVMPGFRVDDPEELGRLHPVARWLPDWVVIVGPCGLRAVLCRGDGDGVRGLVGFRVETPDPLGHRDWFASLGADVEVVDAERLAVVPLVRGEADADHTDPDGTRVTAVAG